MLTQTLDLPHRICVCLYFFTDNTGINVIMYHQYFKCITIFTDYFVPISYILNNFIKNVLNLLPTWRLNLKFELAFNELNWIHSNQALDIASIQSDAITLKFYRRVEIDIKIDSNRCGNKCFYGFRYLLTEQCELIGSIG